MEKTIEITTTVPCVNSCTYCPQFELLRNYKGQENLSLKQFKYFLEKIPQTTKIHFSGFAEPFGNPECMLMIDYAYWKGYDIGLYSTLAGVTESDLELLGKMKIQPFGVHVHKKSNDILYAMLELHVDDFAYIVVGESQSIKTERPVIQQEKISRAGLLWDVDPKKGQIRCVDNRHHQNVLLPNGDIVLCCMDYGMKHVLGNLNDMEYEELFDSKSYKKILAAFEDDSIDLICRYCYRGRKI